MKITTPNKIPAARGSYILFLWLSEPKNIQVGKLGLFIFPAGLYAYFGSAHGSGGLRARLGRHLRGSGPKHWHIDALREYARVACYLFIEHQEPDDLECIGSQALVQNASITVPAPGFGASDCRGGCPAHLFHLVSFESSGINSSSSEITSGWRVPLEAWDSALSNAA